MLSNGSLRALVLLGGMTLVGGYLSLAPFVPDFITSGILDGARNLAEGRGLVTNSITPAFLPYYRDLTLPLAYLWYPLLPIATSLLFAVLGEHAALVLVLPVAGYLLSGLLLFELGRRVFDRATGALAALVLLAQPFMIETAARENFTDPPLVCLVIGIALAVLISAERPVRAAAPWLILAGVLLGLSQYVRWAAAMLYVPAVFLVIVSAPSGRVVRTLVFFGSCLAAQLPLYVWNWLHVGTLTFNPTYVLLFSTSSFPGYAAFAHVLPTSLTDVIGQYGREIAVKWLGQLWVHYKYFFTATSPLLLAAAILSFTENSSGPRRALRHFTVVLYGALVVLNSLVYWDDRYLLPAMPFAALLGVEVLRRSIGGLSSPARRAAVATVVALLVLSPGIDFYYQTWKSRGQFPRLRAANAEWAGFLDAHLRPDDIVMTVDAPQVAWETRHTAVGLSRDPATALLIRERYVPFNTLILDPAPPSLDLFDYSKDWFRIANGDMPFAGFARPQHITLPSGRVVVVLRAAPSGS